jgi:hypothetical protein
MSRYTFGNIFPTWLFLEKRGLTPRAGKVGVRAALSVISDEVGEVVHMVEDQMGTAGL